MLFLSGASSPSSPPPLGSTVTSCNCPYRFVSPTHFPILQLPWPLKKYESIFNALIEKKTGKDQVISYHSYIHCIRVYALL